MNWLLFLLNQLTEDAIMIQEGKRPFTYSWLLILIALLGWKEPKCYQGMDVVVAKACRGAHYQNLWWLEVKEQPVNYVIQCYLYWNEIRDASRKVSHLTEEAAMRYR